ncbi:hypothetical protein, partial [Anaerotruncus colihominis]
MKKSTNPFRSLAYIAVGCCLAITLAALFFNLRLFYVCLGVTVACAALLIYLMRRIKKDINSLLTKMGQALTTVQRETMQTFPIPVFVCGEQGEIIWCNELAQSSVLEHEETYGRSIYTILTGADITRRCPEGGYEVDYKGRHFTAYVTHASAENDPLYIVYFFENTELKRYAREYFETRPSIML